MASPEKKMPTRRTLAPSAKRTMDATVSISLKSKIPQRPLTKMPVCQIGTPYTAGFCAKGFVGSETLTATAYSIPRGPTAKINPLANPHGNDEAKPQSFNAGSDPV